MRAFLPDIQSLRRPRFSLVALAAAAVVGANVLPAAASAATPPSGGISDLAHERPAIKPAARICFTDAWSRYGSTPSQPFASQQACFDFANSGGMPVALSADISLSYDAPTHVLTAHNAGSAPATVTLEASLDDCREGTSVEWRYYSADWNANAYALAEYASVNPIPSGGSLAMTVTATCFVAVEVTASSQFDPDSTPNNHVTTEDDYLVLPIILPLISCCN